MIDYEKLGVFYLGRVYDPKAKSLSEEPYLYDAKDLTTHAAVIGMTGSGKTGLCLTLLEEAAIDSIPAIAIDPKGDIGNLLLNFPNLAASDFRPWVDPGEATRKGQTIDEFAQSQAELWKKGLSDWSQDASRIARLRSSADMAIYTPGSNAGIPVSIVRSFAAPSEEVIADADAFRMRVGSSVGGLLALLGITGDPLESREHILLSTIVDRAWRDRKGIEIPDLLRQIQTPPFDKVGFLDLESFFPSSDRFALVTRLNNLFASPAFTGWMEGEPLDIGRLLHTTEGKPCISIMSIAHLSDSERMFFVTILLNEVISWMRTQSGTSSLRAIIYMDEIFGYFPPTANPPSKTPMLTLLKQARAYGVGVVLATQNPVDLDYKGMANTGTWFLGRLQTDRDKQRVLDGLEGASTASGFSFDRAQFDTMLSGLAGRTFLVNNVHESHPTLFQTRWALSYLRGPLTRTQIIDLMKGAKQVSTPASPTTSNPNPSSTNPTSSPPAQLVGDGHRPMIPPGIEELFLVGDVKLPIAYRPGLIGMAQAHYVDARRNIDHWENVQVIQSIDGEVPHLTWENATLVREQEQREIEKSPTDGAAFAEIPRELSNPKSYGGWMNELKPFLIRYLQLSLWRSPKLKMTSDLGETQGDFRVRIRQLMNENRDREIEKLRQRYAPKLAKIEERIRKAEQRIEKESTQATQSTLQAGINMAGSILSAILGRKRLSVTNVGRASTTVRSAGQVLTQRGDVARAKEDLASLQQEFQQLDEELSVETSKIKEEYATDEIECEEIAIKPRKGDLSVTKVALLWTPTPRESSRPSPAS